MQKILENMEPGDAALLAKALKAYRPETSEEEGIVNFYIEQFSTESDTKCQCDHPHCEHSH
jgi:hypothetical protein